MDRNLTKLTRKHIETKGYGKYFFDFLVDKTNKNYMWLRVKDPTMATKALIPDDEVLSPDLHDVRS
jgi:hypothetical protein